MKNAPKGKCDEGGQLGGGERSGISTGHGRKWPPHREPAPLLLGRPRGFPRVCVCPGLSGLAGKECLEGQQQLHDPR